MRELTALEQMKEWLSDKWKHIFCNHYKIVTIFTAETFIKEKWDRCSGVGTCTKCGTDFTIVVPANKEEVLTNLNN